MSEEVPSTVTPEWLAERVRRVLDGAYYVTYYRSGKAQVNLSEDAREAWVELEVFHALDGRVEGDPCADGHEWGGWIRAGELPSEELEDVRQCVRATCQVTETRQSMGG